MDHSHHDPHADESIVALAQQYGRSVEDVAVIWDQTVRELKASATTWDYVSLFVQRRVKEILAGSTQGSGEAA